MSTMSSALNLVSIIAVLWFSAINCDPQCEGASDVGVPAVWPFTGWPGTYYAWNPSKQECETFYFRGWLGTVNRHDTKDDCQRRCDTTYAHYGKEPYHPSENPFCVEPTNIPLKSCSNQTNFYYVKENNACEPFSGCEGDQNRFYQRNVCENKCCAMMIGSTLVKLCEHH